MWTMGPLRGSLRALRRALLVEDLPEQVGGGLGEGELAEARVDGREVGVDDLVEGAVLHGVVPFAAVPARLPDGSSFLAAGRGCMCVLFPRSSVVPSSYVGRRRPRMPRSSLLLHIRRLVLKKT